MGLWDESIFRTGGEVSKLFKFLHFWVLVWRSFGRNRGPVRAAALSYTTLLAFIPMLAVALSISSLFLKSAGEKQIEEFIQEVVNRVIPSTDISTNVVTIETPSADSTRPAETVDGSNTLTSTVASNTAIVVTNRVETTNQIALIPPAVDGTNRVAISDTRVIAAQKEVAQYIHAFIQNTYSGTLGATGMLVLFITSILTLTRIEETFNDIWGVTRGRDWSNRVAYYLATIVFGPALLFFALGFANGPNFQRTRDALGGLPFVPFILSQTIPLMVICAFFTLFYKLMPNTKVRFRAALVGGTLAGTSLHIYNMLGFLLASRAVTASKIYGSVFLIVLFMGGLYVIWYTVLFGAQVSYAFQNRKAYLQEKLVENVNQRGREFVALRLMTCIGQRFQRGLPLASVPEMSKELGIPSKLIQQVMNTLLSARLVVEVARDESSYAPARPIENINAHHVLMAMRATQGQELITRDEPGREEVYGEFARIQEAEKQVASAVSILTLVNRAQARLELSPGPPSEDIKLTPALVPSSKGRATEQKPITTEEAKTISFDEPEAEPEPEEKIAATVAAAPHPEEPKSDSLSRPLAEPSSDEDRNFPL
jgi:membrane protein